MRVRFLRFANIAMVTGVVAIASGCQSGTSSSKWLSSWRQPATSSLAANAPGATQAGEASGQLPKYPSTTQTPSPSATAGKAATPSNGWANTAGAYGTANQNTNSASPAGYQTGPYAMGAGAQRAGGQAYGNAAYGGAMVPAGAAAAAGAAYSPSHGMNNEMPPSRQPAGPMYGSPTTTTAGYGPAANAGTGARAPYTPSMPGAVAGSHSSHATDPASASRGEPNYPTSYGAQPTSYGSSANGGARPSNYSHPSMPMDNGYRPADTGAGYRPAESAASAGMNAGPAAGGRSWNAPAERPYGASAPTGAESGYRNATAAAPEAGQAEANPRAGAPSTPGATTQGSTTQGSTYRSRWQQPVQEEPAAEEAAEPAGDTGESRGAMPRYPELPRYPETGASMQSPGDDPQFAARGGFRPGSTGRARPAAGLDRPAASEVQPAAYSR